METARDKPVSKTTHGRQRPQNIQLQLNLSKTDMMKVVYVQHRQDFSQRYCTINHRTMSIQLTIMRFYEVLYRS